MSRQTSKSVASKAARTLGNPRSSASEKAAAGSALTQYRSAKEVSGTRAASRASQVLRDPTSTKTEKSVAASTLSQRTRR
jgi:hypothetical protein